MTTYVIWKAVESNVRDDNEVVGLFRGTYEQVLALLALLNEGPRGPYWRSEPHAITLANYRDFLDH